jgi:hypothetical protein
MSTWHKGPPPSIGWWPASFWRDPCAYRWWDGTCWSLACTRYDSAVEAAVKASEPASTAVEEIEWTDWPASWPDRSRT